MGEAIKAFKEGKEDIVGKEKMRYALQVLVSHSLI